MKNILLGWLLMPIKSIYYDETKIHFNYVYSSGVSASHPASTIIIELDWIEEYHLEVGTFSTRLAVQPSPQYKSNGKKRKMAASYFCPLPSDWPKWIYSSIQVQLFDNYSSF